MIWNADHHAILETVDQGSPTILKRRATSWLLIIAKSYQLLPPSTHTWKNFFTATFRAPGRVSSFHSKNIYIFTGPTLQRLWVQLRCRTGRRSANLGVEAREYQPYTISNSVGAKTSNVLWSKTSFACSLGSTDPCSIAVHIKLFSTSAFKAYIWIFSTASRVETLLRQPPAKMLVLGPQ